MDRCSRQGGLIVPKKVPECRNCQLSRREAVNGGKMLHDYCYHSAWKGLELGRRIIKATERRKTSPKWCPKRKHPKEPTKKPPDPDAEFCKDCFYRGRAIYGNLRPCNYLLVTGKSRPCPAGQGCTVKVGTKRNWKSSWKTKRGNSNDGSL